MQWLWKPLIQRALERDHYSVSGCWVIKELCPMFWLTSIGLACSNKGEHLLWALLSAALWAKGKLLSIGVSAQGTFKPEGITTQICTPELSRRWWDWNREDQHPVLFLAWRDQQGRSWQQGQTFHTWIQLVTVKSHMNLSSLCTSGCITVFLPPSTSSHTHL